MLNLYWIAEFPLWAQLMFTALIYVDVNCRNAKKEEIDLKTLSCTFTHPYLMISVNRNISNIAMSPNMLTTVYQQRIHSDDKQH